MRRIFLLTLCLVPAILALPTPPSFWLSSAYVNPKGGVLLRPGICRQTDPSCILFATYNESIDAVGLSKLALRSVGNKDAKVVTYAGGYMEGYLMAPRIAQNKRNFFQHLFNSTEAPAEIVNWAMANYNWTTQTTAQEHPNEAYWFQMHLLLLQFHGLVDGYAAAAAAQGLEPISMQDFWILQMPGDLEDLIPALLPAYEWRRQNPMSMTEEQARAWEMQHGHCTALVRVAPDRSTLMVGHTSWFSYSTMMRVVKLYDLQFDCRFPVVARRVLMSSYPGLLSSVDDFYATEAGLTITETTNNILDETLYDQITSSAVVSWLRALVANRLAATGKQWTDIFSRYNSGTYNSQWLVINNNLFTPGLPTNAPLPDGLLMMLEQIPGDIRTLDATSFLNHQGYWPSFNRPFIQDFYTASGYAAYAAKTNSTWFTYEHSPRANILRRDAPWVNNLADMKTVMQLNRPNDPLAEGNPGNAIAARFDLTVGKTPYDQWWARGPHGGVDSKVITADMVPRAGAARGPMSLHMIVGPTHAQQPAFAFRGEYAGVAHEGLPEEWKFGWETVTFGDRN